MCDQRQLRLLEVRLNLPSNVFGVACAVERLREPTARLIKGARLAARTS
jgi:hypothetical protein